jgi:hypothetical protein
MISDQFLQSAIIAARTRVAPTGVDPSHWSTRLTQKACSATADRGLIVVESSSEKA